MSQKHILTIDNASGALINFVPKKTQPLDIIDWGRAYDLYEAVYLEKFPHLMQDLVSYGHRIRLFMKQGLNWQYYDSSFRQ